MMDKILCKEVVFIFIITLILYVLLIFQPKFIALKPKKKMRKLCKKCPSKFNPLKFSLLFLILSIGLYSLMFKTNMMDSLFTKSCEENYD